jgi:hypothetical protein
MASNAGSVIALLGIGAVVAFAAKAYAGKSGLLGPGPKGNPPPPVTYKGEVVDTSPDNVRVGTKLSLEQWATSQGYKKLPSMNSANADPDFMNVLRAFIVNADNARSDHAAEALFATMKGNALLGIIVYPQVSGQFYDLWALPP